MKYYTESELAWAAGFLDGEGCFSITLWKGRYLKFVVDASQVEKEPLQKLSRLFGGHFNYIQPRGRSRGYWHWRIEGAQSIRAMLPKVIPYLTGTKKKQAKFLLLCCNGVHAGRSNGHPISEREILQRKAMVQKLQEMKR